MKKYAAIGYLALTIGLANLGYVTYNFAKDKEITKETLIVGGMGLGTCITLCGVGFTKLNSDIEDKIKDVKSSLNDLEKSLDDLDEKISDFKE
jgi:peptidoglycan hydrolase CwlO-like protein